jgi:hypothetical protein
VHRVRAVERLGSRKINIEDFPITDADVAHAVRLVDVHQPSEQQDGSRGRIVAV